MGQKYINRAGNLELSAWVKGSPVAQKRHRHAKRGNATITYDPSSKEKEIFLWQVKDMEPKEPLEGPLRMRLYFKIQRPKSHFGTGRNSKTIKDGMPKYAKSRPDIDNYIKFVMDALGKGRFFKDDSQIVMLEAYKMYVPQFDVGGPGTDITIAKIG